MLDLSIKGLRWVACGLSEQEAGNLYGYSVRHWRRFEAGQSTPPPALLDALKARAGFVLAPGWQGFYFDGDNLVLPDGQRLPRRALLASHWLRQSWDDSQRKNVQLDLF